MALNIVFMGTTKFSARVLENLYKSKHRVICVYSQPPSKKKRGQKIGPPPFGAQMGQILGGGGFITRTRDTCAT